MPSPSAHIHEPICAGVAPSGLRGLENDRHRTGEPHQHRDEAGDEGREAQVLEKSHAISAGAGAGPSAELRTPRRRGSEGAEVSPPAMGSNEVRNLGTDLDL